MRPCARNSCPPRQESARFEVSLPIGWTPHATFHPGEGEDCPLPRPGVIGSISVAPNTGTTRAAIDGVCSAFRNEVVVATIVDRGTW